MIIASVQTKREFCIALFNRQLHANSMCPGNHDVDYSHSWFYCDNDPPCQYPEITAEADEIMTSGSHIVCYSNMWNTYVLHEVYDA